MGGDFVSFGINDGFAEFRFDVGSGPAVLKSLKRLKLNEWHTVRLSRNRREGIDYSEVIKESFNWTISFR